MATLTKKIWGCAKQNEPRKKCYYESNKQNRNLSLGTGYELGYLPSRTSFNVAARCEILDYSNLIKVICLKNFMDTLRMPYVDLYPLPVDHKLYTLLVLQLNRSIWKHFIDKKWSRPLGLSLPLNKRSLELNRSTKSPSTNSLFSIFFSWFWIIFSF